MPNLSFIHRVHTQRLEKKLAAHYCTVYVKLEHVMSYLWSDDPRETLWMASYTVVAIRACIGGNFIFYTVLMFWVLSSCWDEDRLTQRVSTSS